MKYPCLSLLLVAAALPAVPASASVSWTSVDSHITVSSYVPGGLSTLMTFSVTATADTSYSDVRLVFPWGYQLSPTVNYPWDNTSSRWENGADFIDILGVPANAATLVTMNTTDLPLTNPTPPGLPAGTVLATDSVPMIDLGSFTAGVPKHFTFQVADGPTTLPGLEMGGMFVVAAPEPASLALLALGTLALLRRRR